MVQRNSWHAGAGIGEQARRVTDWRRERRWRRWSWTFVCNRRWRANCSFSHAWRWWRRFWFLAGFNAMYLLGKTVQGFLGGGFLFVSWMTWWCWMAFWAAATALGVLCYVWVLGLKTNSASSCKNPAITCIIDLFDSLVFFFFCLSSSILWASNSILIAWCFLSSMSYIITAFTLASDILGLK